MITRILLLLIALFWTAQAQAAITIETAAGSSGYGNSISFACDAGTGENRVVFIGVFYSVGWNITAGPTYNGEALTLIETAAHTGRTSKLYKYVAPATGSHTVAATFEGDNSWAAICVPMSGVDQTTPHGTAVANTGTDSPMTYDLTSTTGEVALDALYIAFTSGGSGLTVGADQTSHAEQEYGGTHAGGMSTEAGAATNTMSWTCTGCSGAPWAQVLISVKPAGAGATTKQRRSSGVF